MDATTDAAASSSPREIDPTVREQSKTAWTLGIAAVLLAMIAPCGSYMTLLLALPLGLMASSRARAALASGALDEGSEVRARTGQILGLAAVFWSALILLLVVAVVLLYGTMILVMVFGLNP